MPGASPHWSAAVTDHPTAGELARRYLDRTEARDVDGLLLLLADDAVTELPFAPGSMRSRFEGAADYAVFARRIFSRSLEAVVVFDVCVSEANPSLAFVEFRSDCQTVSGGAYRNRYVVRVEAAGGLITLWREYFDPLALLAVKDDGAAAGEGL